MSLPTGTVTFLFTDIEGSTRLLDELGDRYADVLTEHRRAIREAVDQHGGVEVDTQGDALFIAFSRASDAVAAATDAQAALTAGPVRVRMGLHTGEPGTTAEGYVGIDVHRAARIGNAANGGQIVLSPTTRELLGDDADLRDLGEHRLKDFHGATRLFQLGRTEFPPLRTPDEARLPRAPTPLIGRKKELRDAVRLLSEDGVRLLTITGPGGVGKTRFAVEAATELLDSFTDGARFVDLAPVRSPDAVLPAVGQAVRARESAVEALREQHVLIALDNAEHVAAAATRLGEMLEECPGVALLVTSREPLHLRLERELPLRPMPEAPAVELFRQRVRLGDPDFDGDFTVLAELCSRLDGLPLAIELAAARVKVLGVEGLLERLEDRLPLLTGRGRDVPERQRTLRATIEWSYDLLDREEQRVFSAVGVFVGGFTLDAAEAVAAADLDTLESLVDKSLVQQDKGRLWMLETIREFALERVEGSTRQKHADYFCALGERVFDHTVKAQSDELMDLFIPEYDNILAAIDWFRETDQSEAQLKTTLGCQRYWFLNGPWQDALRRARDALDRYHMDDELRAWGLFSVASFAWRSGRDDLAQRYAREGLDAARALGHPRLTTYLLFASGISEERLGNLDASQALYREAEEIARAAGDERALATVSSNLGNNALTAGDYVSARDHLEQAIAIDRRRGYRAELANTLVDVGFIALVEGRTAAAAGHFAESLSICDELGINESRRWLLEGAAGIAAARSDLSAAMRLLGAAAALQERLGMGDYYPIAAGARERLTVAAREGLGAAGFETAIAEGRALRTHEALELARSTFESTDG